MLKLDKVNFSYSSSPFIEDISLHIKEGENVAIIGPNGSGKSTFIKLIAGLLKPDFGEIIIQKTSIKILSQKQIAKRMAYVPQNVEVKFNFAVKQVVSMGRYPHEQNLLIQDKESEKVVEQALEKTELTHLKERNFSELSGGEKQRAIIASALAQQTNLLLLDEPTSALDLKHQQGIYNLLKELCINES